MQRRARKICSFIFVLVLILGGCSQPETTGLEERLQEQAERVAALEEQVRHSAMIIDELNDRLLPDRRLPESAHALLRDQRVGLWGTDEQAMHFRFLREVDIDRGEALVDTFNAEYSDDFYPGLDFGGIDGHTLTVHVRDPMHLANRMGSTGSRMYMGAATLTFTSLPGVDSVYFDFGDDFNPEMGSHAGPDVLTRLDVADLVEDEALSSQE